jgi:hypothetical protein
MISDPSGGIRPLNFNQTLQTPVLKQITLLSCPWTGSMPHLFRADYGLKPGPAAGRRQAIQPGTPEK